MLLNKQSIIEVIAVSRAYHNRIYQMQVLRWDVAGSHTNHRASLSKQSVRYYLSSALA